MPWKVSEMSELRFALCHAVRTLCVPVAEAAEEFGVSRKTAYKWLTRFDANPVVAQMHDHSRRAHHVHGRSAIEVEQAVLAVRDEHGWGPRKIHAVLRRESFTPLPCLRTVANILSRSGRVMSRTSQPSSSLQRFERAQPNELWQVDHKGPIEVERQKLLPLTVIDDHSRYALSFRPLADRTMATAFSVLWEIFGEVGLPASILSDNAFGALNGRVGGLSWFDMQMVRLGIDPIHGRPYHPQTQGKVEALHGSVMRELIRRHARRDSIENFTQDCEAWRSIYNTRRPHEALDDEVPLSRWRPSDRKRPMKMPKMEYDSGLTLRKIFAPGLITWKYCRVRVGHGMVGEWVSIEEDHEEVVIRYGFKQVRRLRFDQFRRDRVV
jgi:transposase InsO family protein